MFSTIAAIVIALNSSIATEARPVNPHPAPSNSSCAERSLALICAELADSSWDSFSRSGASFSRDGRWIYFESDRSGQSQLWKMPADPNGSGGKAVQVTRKGGGGEIESPDGKHVYYCREGNPSPLMKTPVEGGEETIFT